MTWLGTERKTTAKAAHPLSMADLHWAAGFIEGEGSFNIKTNNKFATTQRVNVSQREREPLDRLVRIFGGIVYVCRSHPKYPLHIWSVTGMRARGIMLTLYVLMGTRRKGQIKAAMEAHCGAPI